MSERRTEQEAPPTTAAAPAEAPAPADAPDPARATDSTAAVETPAPRDSSDAPTPGDAEDAPTPGDAKDTPAPAESAQRLIPVEATNARDLNEAPDPLDQAEPGNPSDEPVGFERSESPSAVEATTLDEAPPPPEARDLDEAPVPSDLPEASVPAESTEALEPPKAAELVEAPGPRDAVDTAEAPDPERVAGATDLPEGSATESTPGSAQSVEAPDPDEPATTRDQESPERQDGSEEPEQLENAEESAAADEPDDSVEQATAGPELQDAVEEHGESEAPGAPGESAEVAEPRDSTQEDDSPESAKPAEPKSESEPSEELAKGEESEVPEDSGDPTKPDDDLPELELELKPYDDSVPYSAAYTASLGAEEPGKASKNASELPHQRGDVEGSHKPEQTDAPEPPAPEAAAEVVPERAEAAKPPADALGSVDEAPEPKAELQVDAAEGEAEKYGNGALRDGPSYQEEIDDQLGARGLDRSEHDKLRLTRTNELSEAQAREVVGVRDAIKLDEGQMVTKVITSDRARDYLENFTPLDEDDKFNPREFGGSIARGCDTADLRSMDQLRDGLALDDGGAGWTPVPPGASEAYQLRFPAPHDMRAEPSLGSVGDQELANHVAGMAGQSDGRAWRDPFLGTGYTGGGVPEWIAEGTGFPHHAEIWLMHDDGAEEAVGFFDKNERLWKFYD